MLLSWPKTIYVGLFPEHSWLQRGRSAPVQAFQFAQMPDASALLRSLETMLDTHEGGVSKGSQLDIIVSDSIGVSVALPWQEALRRPAELQVYAQACFEKLGIVIDEDWVMHIEFRKHRAMGLAFALPRVWLIELTNLVSTRGLQLMRVLPVSAAAYCGNGQHRQDGKTVILLQEAKRNSAMMYGREGLLGCDVEPVTTSAKESTVRLLKRVHAGYNNIVRVYHWMPDPLELERSPSFISDCLPDVEVHRLVHNAWS